jgi:hypothetical protein
MRNYLLAGGLAVVLTVCGGSLAVAGGGSSDKRGGVTVFKLTLKHEQQTDFDLGATGPSVGDRFTVFADVFKNGKKVGQGGYECSTLAFAAGPDPNGPPKVASDQCDASVVLERGQITVQGLVNRAGTIPISLPIVGGTGAYRTARGQIETSGPDDHGNEELTVKLISERRK